MDRRRAGTSITGSQEVCDVAVIGGGPAGASIARLLVERGRRVIVIAPADDPGRGLAESLPPSARKALAAVGALEAVDAAGFCRSRGNTVWWGNDGERHEAFDSEPDAVGYQVWRPDLDRLLLDGAVTAGAIRYDATVRQVQCVSDTRVEVTCAGADGQGRRVIARFVVDASGRSGVVARQRGRRVCPVRTHAWVGLWRHPAPLSGRDLDTTLVESYADGWAWSVPVSPSTRCATVMIDPDRTAVVGDARLEARYLHELNKTRHLSAAVANGRLERVWGCDATFFETDVLGGPQHLVVGDAACFIDPLSSFGVKKALASAWTGAAVVHTCLDSPQMRGPALEFFTRRERELFRTKTRQSADYAREAASWHRTDFWRARAQPPAAIDDARVARTVDDPARVRAAFEQLKRGVNLRLRRAPSVRFEWQAAIQGQALALERAVVAPALPAGVRFMENVDVTRLVELADELRPVGDLFDGYCRHASPVPLPDFLKVLSVLVAGQALEPAEC